ncbi:MAG: flagellar filament capping protein FliD [Candidatus Riflebacteria bacterium]|nr:flagellar filament capping protein FliD [Candidatus Riflebacteria bacterium]
MASSTSSLSGTSTSTGNRTWVGGLASGIDTQSLVDKFMTLERAPLDALQQKATTLSFQKSLLQDINLKLFDTQNKASDILLSKSFNSKLVKSTDEKYVSADASTLAKVGSYSVQIKQLATTTQVDTSRKLSQSFELGQNIASSGPMGGTSSLLSPYSGNPAGETLTLSMSGTDFDFPLGLNANSSVSDFVTAVNNSISSNSTLNGKVSAQYDERNNQIRFALLDKTKTISVKDKAGTVIQNLFGTSTINLTSGNSSQASAKIRNEGNTYLSDMGVNSGGQINITYGTTTKTLDLPASANTSLVDTIDSLNHQIDQQLGFSGNPADRKVEFRYDSSVNKLRLVNTAISDSTSVSVSDVATSGSNFVSKLFGGSTVNSTNDQGAFLASANTSSPITSGNFTVDGVQISVNAQTDKLQDVLQRITNTTGITAGYDSQKDVISFTRKDGQSAAIGLGSTADSSNFLSVMGLITGSQATSAFQESVSGINSSGQTISQADTQSAINTIGTKFSTAPVGNGTLRVTLNGTSHDIAYDTTSDSINSVLDKIKKVDGISDAWFDTNSQKIRIETSQKGSSSNLQISDIGASGNLASAFRLNATSSTGQDLGASLESSKAISNITTSKSFATAGFAKPISTGTFTINGAQFNILNTSTMTLDNVISAINGNATVGVSAEFDPTTGKLMLTSKTTGNSAIALGSTSDTSNFLSAVGLSQAQQDVGKNAIFNISGKYGGNDIIRQTNDVSDVIDGLTMHLKGITSGTPETITVSADVTTSRKNVDDFLKSYNDTVGQIYTKLNEKRDYTLSPLTSTQRSTMTQDQITAQDDAYKVGLLSGDSMLMTLRSSIRSTMSGSVTGLNSQFNSLASIGISTGVVGSGYQDTEQGTLQVTDETKLTDALTNHPDEVAALFSNDSTTSSAQGLARQLKNVLNNYTKSNGILTQRVGVSGSVVSNSEIDTQISQINKQISDQQERLKSKEDALIKQYSDMESAISQYQSQSTAFSQQLAKMTSSS